MKRICFVLALILALACSMQLCVAEDGGHDVLILDQDLFLVPIIYEDEESGYLSEPDTELHYFPLAAEMQLNGAYFWGLNDMPEGYAPAEEGSGKIMHIWTIMSPDGGMYIPLFISFSDLFAIFGENVHIGVISYAEAREQAMTEVVDTIDGVTITQPCAGIVLAPGAINEIIPAEQLQLEMAELEAAETEAE